MKLRIILYMLLDIFNLISFYFVTGLNSCDEIEDCLKIGKKGFLERRAAEYVPYITALLNLYFKSGILELLINGIVQELKPQDLVFLPQKTSCSISVVKAKLQFFMITCLTDSVFKNDFRNGLGDDFYRIFKKVALKISLDEKDYLVPSLLYKLIYLIDSIQKRIHLITNYGESA